MELTLYDAIALLVSALWAGYWAVHLMAIFYGKWKLHQKTCQLSRETPYPGISILKPLVGVDPNLFNNLETFFTMNYPTYELLFCVAEASDPACMLVKRLMEKYPDVQASLFVGGTRIGVNPKLNNLQPGYEAAKYEYLMISDSGIRMKEDTLMDMFNHMKDDVGMVHQMPFVCDRTGFPAALEMVYFGTAHARIYLTADLVGINCATGMSSLFRKKLIDAAGGLKAFACYLAEDFFLAKMVTDSGYKIRISHQPAWQNSGSCEVSFFQARITRWAKLRIAMVPTTILLEPITECMLLGTLASWSLFHLLQWDPLVFYLVHILVWFLLDYTLLSTVQNGPLPFSRVQFISAWLFREFSAPLLFLHALWSPRIRWRNGYFKLRWGGIAEEVTVPSKK